VAKDSGATNLAILETVRERDSSPRHFQQENGPN
jgi:hypothetical protein